MTAAPGHWLVLLCGMHSLGFGLFHLAFWKLFDWPGSLRPAGVGNRAITQILNLRLAYVFLGVAALCFAFPEELAGTAMGRAVLLGMSGFWVGRTIEHYVFLRIDRPMLHALTFLFVVGAAIFAGAGLLD